MDILCLMGLFPKEFEHEIEKNSVVGIQNAANKLQWNLVKGLDQQENIQVHICNSVYIGAYPKKYKSARIPEFTFEHREGVRDINTAFINLPYIKIFSRYFSARRIIDRWACDQKKDKKTLLVYALTTPFVQLAGYATKKYPDIKVCVIVPDLPEYMNVGAMEKGGIYAKIKKIEIKCIRRAIREIKSFVLLTDAMKTWFDHEIRYTVMEGIAESRTITDQEKKEYPHNIIYAGGIKREYGVADLVLAFKSIPTEKWKLTIYGDGSDLEYVRKLAAEDDRISFPGSVPNSVVVEEQRKASLLVNPRKNQQLAKYSFPSKILEYMASGTPMLAYSLDGVPGEYDPYYYHIGTEADGMKKGLEFVMSLSDDELQNKGNSARKFVLENKNSKIQCKKIVDFLNIE